MMQFQRSTIFQFVAVLFCSSILVIQIDAENETCDRVLDTMIESCKGIRNTLISLDSLNASVACCKNARYDMCVKGVKGYVTVATTARLCQDAGYEEKVTDLESNIAMQAVKKLCETFDTKTCITETVTSAWQSIAETLNPSSLSETISKNFQSTMNSISGFVRSIGGQTQDNANHYSVVSEGGKADADQTPSSSDGSFTFSKLFGSISQPAIEIAEKNNNQEKKQETGNFGENAKNMLDSILGAFRTN